MGCFRIFLVSSGLLFFAVREAFAEYRFHSCPNTTNFTPNSTYHSNRDLLLASLNSNATRESGFYNATAGHEPDAIFGSFLCQGGLTPDGCRNCVAAATNDATRTYCPNEKEVMLWYGECTLRYSAEYFFGIMDEAPSAILYNVGKINEPERFAQILESTINESITAAAYAPADSDKKFATRETSFSVFQTLYSLVQCTPDLSSSDCNRCLRGAAATLPICCSGAVGANVLYPSCNLRYELYPFYNATGSTPTPTPTPLSPPPPLASGGKDGKISPAVVVSICVSVAVVLLVMSVGFYWLKRRGRVVRDDYNAVQNDVNDITTVESLQYDLSTIQIATNNFSDDNKLGEGGFGAVYKGTVSNGQVIAVKRLSSTSLQGAGEFKNEVLLVAKLQHRNLTRLLGFCLEREEKLLVYEFVPNKSLDNFIFDDHQPNNNQRSLNWTRRYKIIGGVARGMLYLHEDSRLRIIHRDLKAGNILLDEEMNPKISDFGMAKICGVDQTQGNTSRIVGTFGYMAPEYAFYGQFSVKSDVFSFGVLVIEIVTGKKCSRFVGPESETEDLLCFTWRHWRNKAALEILDPRLGDSYTANEVMRCVHIGLLCVQEDPAERPTMATIVLMLSSFSVSLPLPKQPAFFPHTRTEEILEPDRGKSSSESHSINEMSFTETYPR